MLGMGWKQPDGAQAVEIEPVIWQFNVDYPGSEPDDGKLQVRTAYIKTHDAAYWMSRYDPSPNAVSGPDSIRRLIDEYRARGIELIAWFVPKGRDVEGQLQRAKEVLDSGVKALYADLEPYPGFCNSDCAFLAENFWWRLRSERPSANLGVIYDPRPAHWETSATAKWFAAADAALPMCYFDSFANQGVWADPGGCVRQAHADLARLAPGRNLEYIPMVQGDTSGERFAAALKATEEVGSSRLSIWRRGNTNPDVWSVAIAHAKSKLPPPPCTETLADGCLVREKSSDTTYVLYGHAKFAIPNEEFYADTGLDLKATHVVPDGFLSRLSGTPGGGTLVREIGTRPVYGMIAGVRLHIPDVQTFARMGYDWKKVRVVPRGSLADIPTAFPDGALVHKDGSKAVYVIYGGAKFHIPDPAAFSTMGLDWDHVQKLSPRAFDLIPSVPRNGTWLTEMGTGRHWLIQGGTKFPVESSELRAALIAGGQMGGRLFIVPAGALDQVPGLDAKPRERAVQDLAY